VTPKTPYQLGRLLEAGSTGEVYEASHPFLPGQYVVKVLRPGLAQSRSAVEIFRAELATIAALRHPNIVQVMETGEMSQDARPFVVMERLDGRTLESRLNDGRALPPEEVVTLVKGIAAALQAAHSKRVVHRELHPGNIFLAHAEGHELGFPKILNFGIARLRNASGGDAGVGAEEARYMAPEQAQGHADEIDGRTDQFALAAIAYRLLAGADAFRGADPIAVLYQVVHEPPEPMNAFAPVDPGVEDVVLRGLSKRQAERFDTVIELARALEDAVKERSLRREGEVVLMGKRARRDTGEAETIDVERPRAYTPFNPSGMALSGGGVLRDEPVWTGPVDDGFDDDLDRVPHHRGRLALFLIGFAIVCAVAAVWAGWQPPLALRQSQLWHTLRLPHAAAPGVAASERPPAPPTDLSAPASPPPVTGAAAPAPSAPALPGAGGANPPTAVPAEAAPAAPVAAPAAPVAAPAAPVAAPALNVAEEEATAARAERRPRKEPRARSRHDGNENMNLRGVVWSEKEQRLVPVGAMAPSDAPPAPVAPRQTTPVTPSLPPADAPLPLSTP
jgi:serine/threonine-protein kinase